MPLHARQPGNHCFGPVGLWPASICNTFRIARAMVFRGTEPLTRGTVRSRAIFPAQFAKKISILLCALFAVLGGCRTDPKVRAHKYFQSGFQYYQKGLYDEAAIQFGNALQIEPNDFDAHYYMGLSSIRLQRVQRAYRELTRAVELQPASVPAHLALGDLLIAGNRPLEAQQQLEAARKVEPQNPQVLMELGKCALVQKDYATAASDFDQTLQLSSNNASLWLMKGLVHIGQKQMADAAKDFQKAIELDPQSAEGYRNLASLYVATKRPADAEAVLQQAIGMYPRTAELYYALADVFVRQRQNDKADALFSQMKSHPKDFQDLDLNTGQFWMNHNQLVLAAEEFKVVLGKEENLLALKNLISADLTLGRVDEASAWNQKLLKKNPKDLEGLTFAGAIDCLRGNYNVAVHELQDVLKEEPSSLVGNYYLGLSWMGLGEDGAAKATFENLLKIQSNFPHVYLKFAEISLRQGDWKAGETYAKEALAADPGVFDAALLLAQADLMHDDVASAQKVVDAMKQSASLPAEFYEVSAQLAEKKHRDSEAVSDYEQALAISSRPVAVLEQYAAFLERRGRLKEAVERVDRFVQSGPPQPNVFELSARLKLEAGDFSGADAASRQTIVRNAGSWQGHYLLGEALEKEGRQNEAWQQYDQAVQVGNSPVAPYLAAGKLAEGQGQFDRARQYFLSAVQHDPDSADAQFALARFYSVRGEHLDQALSLALSVRSRYAADPQVADVLGWIYYQKGLYDLAIKQLQLAAEAFPDDATVQAHLGLTYARRGEKKKAVELLNRSLKLSIPSQTLSLFVRDTLRDLAGS